MKEMALRKILEDRNLITVIANQKSLSDGAESSEAEK
jgi:hypothetical protein